MNPIVTVLEVKEDNVQALTDAGFDLAAFLKSKGPRTSTGRPEVLLNACLQAYAAQSRTIFFLAWKGSKIPRGAVIRGHTIAWTQNGLVSAENGVTIGTYSRLVEFGPNDEQQMLIYYLEKQ